MLKISFIRHTFKVPIHIWYNHLLNMLAYATHDHWLWDIQWKSISKLVLKMIFDRHNILENSDQHLMGNKLHIYNHNWHEGPQFWSTYCLAQYGTPQVPCGSINSRFSILWCVSQTMASTKVKAMHSILAWGCFSLNEVKKISYNPQNQ